MFEKLIYQKLEEDFSFLKDYGFCYLSEFQHRVTPAVRFQGDRYGFLIGFSYEEKIFS